MLDLPRLTTSPVARFLSLLYSVCVCVCLHIYIHIYVGTQFGSKSLTGIDLEVLNAVK